jgi:energy-coupling factor transporter transmembrane protein EcfT
MGSSVQTDLEEQSTSKLSTQALSFFLHSLLALASWMALMLLGYAINPSGVPQLVILLLSAAVPLAAGFLVARIYPAEMATLVWLLGLIWLLIVCLWVLNMPTGPNQCFHCEATDKLTRTFFSWPRPSGLIDDDGPFIATWPAVALVGYSIGAKLGFRRK